MGKVNLYYHADSNTWWTDSILKDLELKSFVDKHGCGVGSVSINISNGLHKVSNALVPDTAKFLSGFKTPKDIEDKGFRVTQEELIELLDNK